MIINKNILSLCLSLGLSLWLISNPALAQTGVVCGYTENGQESRCGEDQKCYKCKERTHPWSKKILEFAKKSKGAALLALPGVGGAAALSMLRNNVEYNYECKSQDAGIPKNCTYAPNGGLKGETKKKFLFITLSKDTGQQCIVANFMLKYADCYGCAIVETLASAFVKAGGQGYNVSKQAGNALLILCTMIWLAFFALKNVSSFTSVEPMKMLQDLFVQLFKVIVALVVLNSGIQTILSYTVVPLMNAGTDFGDEILNTLTDQTSDFEHVYDKFNLREVPETKEEAKK